MPDRPTHDSPSRRDADRDISQWYRLSGIGLEFILAVLLLGGVGFWLDVALGTLPLLMLIGGALGFAIGIWLMLRAAFRSFRD